MTSYTLWSPGAKVSDGRHDLGRNGVWMQHGWLGHDDWFERYQRDTQRFRNKAALEKLAVNFSSQRFTYLFPHLCPCQRSGQIDSVDHDQVERFLDHFPDQQVIPWIGGVLNEHCFLDNERWRKEFIHSTVALLDRHPRLAGVQINIEPLPSGNTDFLQLLTELRAAMQKDKILSVAAYPPPTILHPFPSVHWEESYFRSVAERVDLLVPMMYDTSIRLPKFYQHLMKNWTHQVLTWSGETQVLLGVPAYDDGGADYHDPRVENLEHSLHGIHAALASYPSLPQNYQGIAIYSEWEMESHEWATLKQAFFQTP